MKKSEQKFEQIISELESIVADLDNSIGLEESLKKFEQGMALAKQAEERLKMVENEFQKIQQQFDLKDDAVESEPMESPTSDVDLNSTDIDKPQSYLSEETSRVL